MITLYTFNNSIHYFRRFMKNTPPIKQKNSDLRPREFLTESEVEKLYSAAKKMGTFGYRNYCMLLITFKHGLRSSELLSLKKSQINLTENVIHLKGVTCRALHFSLFSKNQSTSKYAASLFSSHSDKAPISGALFFVINLYLPISKVRIIPLKIIESSAYNGFHITKNYYINQWHVL